MHTIPNMLNEFKFISTNIKIPFNRVRNKETDLFRVLGDLFSLCFINKCIAPKPRAGDESK